MASPFVSRLSYFVLSVLGSLPLELARKVGAGLGHIVWCINGRERWVTEKNIRTCFPELSEREQKRLAKSSVIETARLALEIIVVWKRDQDWLSKKLLGIEGEELVRDAVQAGKGLIVLGPHLGNWEVLGKHLPTYGPVSNLYQPPKQQWLEEFVKNSRETSGAQLVPTNKRGVAALLGRLRRGEISGILPDQVPEDGSGKFTTFFGVPAYTMTLVNGLINRTGCAVVVAFAKRVKGGFVLCYRKPDEAIYSDDADVALQAMSNSVEALVREAPEQYQWEYKRFKKQADDKAGRAFYRR